MGHIFFCLSQSCTQGNHSKNECYAHARFMTLCWAAQRAWLLPLHTAARIAVRTDTLTCHRYVLPLKAAPQWGAQLPRTGGLSKDRPRPSFPEQRRWS